MRFILISVLVLLVLLGCSTGTPLPTGAPPRVKEGFGIYLLAQDIPPQQLASLSHLELQETPFLSVNDIVSYRWETHEIELTAAGYEKIHSLSVPTRGKAFAVCADGEPVYVGALWVAYSSQSFDGVIIETTLVNKEHPVLRIELGYPGPDFFRGEDPRSDARIFQALERAGKLR